MSGILRSQNDSIKGETDMNSFTPFGKSSTKAKAPRETRREQQKSQHRQIEQALDQFKTEETTYTAFAFTPQHEDYYRG